MRLKLLLAGSFILFFANIWGVSIYIFDESRNAGCAREMWMNDEWIIPTFNGELRDLKPVLHYYFMRAGYSIFGSNAAGARFFSSLSGVILVWVTFLFVKKHIGENAAFLSGLVLLAAIHNLVQFHLAVPDPYLILFIASALYLFYDYYRERKIWQIYACYAVMALGVLTKGPIALALPGFTAMLYLLYKRDFTFQSIISFRPVTGVLLLFLIAAPWFVLVHQATNGAFTEGFFLKHNLQRFSSTMEGHGGPFYLTLIYVIGGLLPFSFFIVHASSSVVNEKNDLLVFSGLAALVVVVFFAVSETKLPNYTTPSYPFVAIVLGAWMARFKAGDSIRYIWIAHIVLLVVAIALPVGARIGLQAEKHLAGLSYLAWLFVPFPFGTGLATLFLVKKQWLGYWYSIAGGAMVTSLLFFYVSFPRLDDLSPAKTWEKELSRQVDRLVIYQAVHPSFIYPRNQPIPVIETEEKLKNYLRETPNAVVLSQRRKVKVLVEKGVLIIDKQQRDLFEPRYSVVCYAANPGTPGNQ